MRSGTLRSKTSDILFPYRTPFNNPAPTRPNTPRRTRNGPKRTRNGPQRTRNRPKLSPLGWDGLGGFGGTGGGGGVVREKENRGWLRFGLVRLRFGDGTVRAVPVFGSGGSSKEGFFCVFQYCFTERTVPVSVPGKWFRRFRFRVRVLRKRFRRFRFPVPVRFLGHPENPYQKSAAFCVCAVEPTKVLRHTSSCTPTDCLALFHLPARRMPKWCLWPLAITWHTQRVVSYLLGYHLWNGMDCSGLIIQPGAGLRPLVYCIIVNPGEGGVP